MGITTIPIHGHDGWGIGDKILAPESFHEPLLDFKFIRAAASNVFADFRKDRCPDGIDGFSCSEVQENLLLGPSGFESAIRFAELITFNPKLRIRSMAPASAVDAVKIMLFGENCMATAGKPESSSRSLSTSCCQDA